MTVFHEFVDYIPDKLADYTIYISIRFGTVVHKCLCGCSNEVVTPLSPTNWTLSFDGETISLDPSIGNWSFPCQSHYWIVGNRVRWARRWSQIEITQGRNADRAAKDRQYGTVANQEEDTKEGNTRGFWGFWRKLKMLILRG